MIYGVRDKLAGDDARQAAELYTNAFAELNTETVQRHLMNQGELHEVFGDDRIRKYTVCDEAGNLIGLSLQTNKLEAHPLISVPFFEKKYPELTERQAIWYIMTVCVDVERASREVFPALIRQMMQPIRATRGMGVLDYSSYIIAQRRLDAVSLRYISGCAPLDKAEVIGSQVHVAYTFDWDKESQR